MYFKFYLCIKIQMCYKFKPNYVLSFKFKHKHGES